MFEFEIRILLQHKYKTNMSVFFNKIQKFFSKSVKFFQPLFEKSQQSTALKLGIS